MQRRIEGWKCLKNFCFLLLCFLLLLFFYTDCSRSAGQAIDQVCFGEQCINVEVVQKEEDLSRGLQLRKTLAPDTGMLFVFAKSRPYAFWMKDTLIPIDMIWMDSAQRIVHIEHHVPPCTQDPCPHYTPPKEALYVLEVNAGYAETLGLKLGDTAEFRLKSF